MGDTLSLAIKWLNGVTYGYHLTGFVAEREYAREVLDELEMLRAELDEATAALVRERLRMHEERLRAEAAEREAAKWERAVQEQREALRLAGDVLAEIDANFDLDQAHPDVQDRFGAARDAAAAALAAAGPGEAPPAPSASTGGTEAQEATADAFKALARAAVRDAERRREAPSTAPPSPDTEGDTT